LTTCVFRSNRTRTVPHHPLTNLRSARSTLALAVRRDGQLRAHPSRAPSYWWQLRR
jgi:hypothetical protein